MRALALSIGAAFLLLGCSDTGSIKDENGAAFVTAVRDGVPSTSAYDDEYLLDIAENVCTLGNVEDGVRILDNYSQLEAEDYEEFASIALSTACPDAA